MDNTPIQQVIKWMQGNWTEEEIQKDGYLKHFWEELQWQLPKEKEFAEGCFDAGYWRGRADLGDLAKLTDHPDQQEFLNQLYPKS